MALQDARPNLAMCSTPRQIKHKLQSWLDSRMCWLMDWYYMRLSIYVTPRRIPWPQINGIKRQALGH